MEAEKMLRYIGIPIDDGAVPDLAAQETNGMPSPELISVWDREFKTD